MSWLDKLNPFKKPLDAAADVMTAVATTGMKVWDNKDFSPQERAGMLLKYLEATKSQATSISRRHLLWFIIGMVGTAFVLALGYNALGLTDHRDGVIKLVTHFKLDWAFVSAVSFYYAAHLLTGGKK